VYAQRSSIAQQDTAGRQPKSAEESDEERTVDGIH